MRVADKSISIIKQISRNVNINWDRLHSTPCIASVELKLVVLSTWRATQRFATHHAARRKKIHCESLKISRLFPRLFKYFFSLLRHEARRMAKRKERSKTFFNVAFRNLLQSDFFSDPRLRYIKQAPLVIINERMSYCELFFPRAFVDAKINVAIEMVFRFFNKLDVWSDSTFSTS